MVDGNVGGSRKSAPHEGVDDQFDHKTPTTGTRMVQPLEEVTVGQGVEAELCRVRIGVGDAMQVLARFSNGAASNSSR